MVKSPVRPTDDEIECTVKSYSNMLFKLCFTVLCNRADAEDIGYAPKMLDAFSNGYTFTDEI